MQLRPLAISAYSLCSAAGDGRAATLRALRERRSGLQRNDFGVSPLALSAVVRVTTNAKFMLTPSSLPEAFAFCDAVLASGVAVPGFGTGGGALRGWLLLLGAVSDNGPPLPPLGALDAT